MGEKLASWSIGGFHIVLQKRLGWFLGFLLQGLILFMKAQGCSSITSQRTYLPPSAIKCMMRFQHMNVRGDNRKNVDYNTWQFCT